MTDEPDSQHFHDMADLLQEFRIRAEALGAGFCAVLVSDRHVAMLDHFDTPLKSSAQAILRRVSSMVRGELDALMAGVRVRIMRGQRVEGGN